MRGNGAAKIGDVMVDRLDGVVGETVSGYIKPGGESKLMATTVNFGQKPAPQETDKPKAATSAEKPPKPSQPQ